MRVMLLILSYTSLLLFLLDVSGCCSYDCLDEQKVINYRSHVRILFRILMRLQSIFVSNNIRTIIDLHRLPNYVLSTGSDYLCCFGGGKQLCGSAQHFVLCSLSKATTIRKSKNIRKPSKTFFTLC